MVPNVSWSPSSARTNIPRQSQPFARILIYVAGGIAAINVALVSKLQYFILAIFTFILYWYYFL